MANCRAFLAAFKFSLLDEKVGLIETVLLFPTLSLGNETSFLLGSLLPYSFGSWWLRQWKIYLQCRKPGFNPWVGKIPWRREWQPTPVLLPGEFHGQRSLAGFHPLGDKELDTTEWLIAAARYGWKEKTTGSRRTTPFLPWYLAFSMLSH